MDDVVIYGAGGRGARVEAGAVVIRDVPPNTTVGGVPAAAPGVLGSRFIPANSSAPPRELVLAPR